MIDAAGGALLPQESTHVGHAVEEIGIGWAGWQGWKRSCSAGIGIGVEGEGEGETRTACCGSPLETEYLYFSADWV